MNGRGVVVIAALCMLGALALLVGCGSSDDGGTTAAAASESSAPLTKAQFAKQAEQICAQGGKEKDAAVAAVLKELSATAEGAPTEEERANLVEKAVVPPYQKAVTQLSELSPPKGDEAEVEKMVGTFESALKSMEAEPLKATQHNPFTAADAAAEAYGVETCSL